jgi:DNA-binding CsgD family transcriptional regulator
MILERSAEYDAIRLLVGRAQAGQGGLLVVEASAGLGKTTLLAKLSRLGERSGMAVAQARGSDLERQYPYGIVRQLLEPSLRDPQRRNGLLVGAAALAAPVVDPSAIRPEHADADPSAFSVLYGLYWLVATLAQHAPMALVVDDVHLADTSSLRFLSFLARRITELPVLLAVALRPAEADGQVLHALTGEPGAQVIRPEPLSLEAVSVLVGSALKAQPSPEFAEACHLSTGGNPFFVGELVRDLATRAIAPNAAESRRVRHLGPPSIARAVLFRLAVLPRPATPLVRACAVLGDGSRLADCAGLAGIRLDEAESIADALVRASVLTAGHGLTFVHPIVRAAVEADLGPHERERLHRQAAALLIEQGADADQIALHLIRTEPRGQPATVECLRAAAAGAVQKGALDEAAAYLQRALVEPPPPPSRPDVTFELGRVEAASGAPEGIRHLKEGLAGVVDPTERARRALLVADFAVLAGQTPEAVRMLSDARTSLGGRNRQLGGLLDVKRYWAGRLDGATYREVANDVEKLDAQAPGQESGARREVLVYLACENINSVSSATALDLLGEALAPPGLLAFHDPGSVAVGSAVAALCYLDRIDEFDELVDAALAEASRRGDLVGFVLLSTFNHMALLRRGKPVDAAAGVRETLQAAGMGGWALGSPTLLAALVDALLDMGDVQDAATALADNGGLANQFPAHFAFSFLLYSRGRLRLAQDSPATALRDLLDCGERLQDLSILSPGTVPWRSSAALAHLALGDRSAAIKMAEEELDLARRLAGSRAVGVALRVLGLSTTGESGIELLREAVEVLAGANARLEHARALVDLGAAVRRTGQRMRAREHLSRGLEIATMAGANGLASKAREELLATGARPRRVQLHGVEALTASERRVARMAASGRSNPEIAQALFVTRKTVEKQLAGVYRKLGIRTRAELAASLMGQDNG